MRTFTADSSSMDDLTSILSNKMNQSFTEGGNQVVEGSTNIIGLDVFDCENASPWRCTVFQPNWIDGEEQGYPRFGGGNKA